MFGWPAVLLFGSEKHTAGQDRPWHNGRVSCDPGASAPRRSWLSRLRAEDRAIGGAEGGQEGASAVGPQHNPRPPSGPNLRSWI